MISSWANEWHEDGRSISCGFCEPWLIPTVMVSTFGRFTIVRHLCPTLYFFKLEAKAKKLKIVREPSDEGGFIVYGPSLPGCISEGDTKDEASDSINYIYNNKLNK